MKQDYEILSENCKLCWHEGFELNGQKHTQVSGYIFDENNKLLIVKNGKTWTIPGGHPENNEKFVETLTREVMEEACVTIKDIQYLGAVEVVEKGETYYQLRFIARVLQVLPFTKEWETSERMFASLEDLPQYISWSNGITFKGQINSAVKFLENENK